MGCFAMMTVLKLMILLLILIKMRTKYHFMRTKSQCRQPQHSPNNPHVYSYSTHMKFKPFSSECTMDHIEQTLQSFRNTLTHQRTRSSIGQDHTHIPIINRLKIIINSNKTRRKKKRTFVTQGDDESEESELVEDRLKRLTNRSNEVSKSRIRDLQQKENEVQGRHQRIPLQQVRHDLSQQTYEHQNAFYTMLHKPKTSILMSDFNKNNCFLFSRSKRKILAVQQQKIPKKIENQQRGNKFQSFGSYYYGSYMKKYIERKNLLGKKTMLINRVMQ